MANMSFANNAATTLASNITNVTTSFTVASGTGSLFPTLTGSQYFYCTLENGGGTSREIVKVTARSTDTFTVVRGQDGTTGTAFSLGDKVELRLVRANLQDFALLDEANTFTQQQTFATTGIKFNDATVQTTAFAGSKSQVFTSNGTFTIPVGVTALKIIVIGGGGGGGSSSGGFIGGAGAGGTAISYLTGLTPNSTLAVTVGAGGAQGGAFNAGGTGGASTVASGTQTISTITANGGVGSPGDNQGAIYPSNGGSASGGTINITGNQGGYAFFNDNTTAFTTGGVGGSTMLGSGGIGATTGIGGTASGYGAGAGGSANGLYVGGIAAPGVVIFEW